MSDGKEVGFKGAGTVGERSGRERKGGGERKDEKWSLKGLAKVSLCMQ